MRRTYFFILAGLSIALALGVLAWCRPLALIKTVRPGWLAMAGLLFAASLSVWSAIWTSMLAKAARADSTKGCSFLQAFGISMASLAGMTTPLNLGSDALRSWYARRYLGLPANLTVGASLVTRELKLHVTFPLVLSAVAWPLADSQSGEAWLALAGIGLIEVVIGVLRMRWARPFVRGFGLEAYAKRAVSISKDISRTRRGVAYLGFSLGFFFEWLALVCAIEALGLQLPWGTSAWLYIWLYLLSRTPLSLQGIGVVEVGGLIALTATGLTREQIGALLAVWAAIRLATPLALSATFVGWLAAAAEERDKGHQRHEGHQGHQGLLLGP